MHILCMDRDQLEDNWYISLAEAAIQSRTCIGNGFVIAHVAK